MLAFNPWPRHENQTSMYSPFSTLLPRHYASRIDCSLLQRPKCCTCLCSLHCASDDLVQDWGKNLRHLEEYSNEVIIDSKRLITSHSASDRIVVSLSASLVGAARQSKLLQVFASLRTKQQRTKKQQGPPPGPASTQSPGGEPCNRQGLCF